MGRRFNLIAANVLKGNGWPIDKIALRLEISEEMVRELLASDEIPIDKPKYRL